jgi:hypothetical protein
VITVLAITDITSSDGLVVAAELPQDHETHRNREQAAGDGGPDPREWEGQVEAADVVLKLVARCAVRRQRKDSRGVRADGLEHDEAEVHDAGDAEDEVE